MRRSRGSSVRILLVSKMTKSPPNPPAPGETSGSAAANRTSSPASLEGKSTSRTPTTTPPAPRDPPELARSTLSLPARTYAAGKLSFLTSPASPSSLWCLTFTRLLAARSATIPALTEPEEPSSRHPTTGSSCREGSATPYRCPRSCHAQRWCTWRRPWPPTITAL